MTEPSQPTTILIVDDEPGNLAVLASLLQPRYRVRAANSGARALLAAASNPRPDLILLDVMMADLDGYAVIEQLKREPRTRDIPVVFVTTLDESTDEERGLMLGAVDYISKPIRPAVALARIQTHLTLKQTRDRLARQNASLEAEVERRTIENAMTMDVSLCVIAGMVETRDVANSNHTIRTQAYVEVLTQRLQRASALAKELSPTVLARIVKAVPLHDIGKIGISDAILLKPSPLTNEEFETMKTHTRIGADLISRSMVRVQNLTRREDASPPDVLAFLENARQIALWHHERWDGSGYPDRLAGTAIPVGARMMAVADVFDALTTHRAYKPLLAVDQAIEILVGGRGTQFDPDIIDAFAASAEDFKAIARRFPDDTG